MNTVFSNFHPAQITQKKLNDVWMDLFLGADEVLMATGYVSNDAVIELQRITYFGTKNEYQNSRIIGRNALFGGIFSTTIP
jgi:type-2 restriction enzyme ngoFVII